MESMMLDCSDLATRRWMAWRCSRSSHVDAAPRRPSKESSTCCAAWALGRTVVWRCTNYVEAIKPGAPNGHDRRREARGAGAAEGQLARGVASRGRIIARMLLRMFGKRKWARSSTAIGAPRDRAREASTRRAAPQARRRPHELQPVAGVSDVRPMRRCGDCRRRSGRATLMLSTSCRRRRHAPTCFFASGSRPKFAVGAAEFRIESAKTFSLRPACGAGVERR